MEPLKSFNPCADVMLILLAKHDPGVLLTSRCHMDVIGIVRTEDTTHFGRPFQMIDVGISQQTEITHGDRVYAPML